jgi:predicted nuclease of predicted toxin-antitoxin system
MSKLLLDSCVWGKAREELAAAGHDVVWTGEWSVDPGDEEIMARAHAEGRILVTLDKDFGHLAIVIGLPHCGIIRLVDIAAERQAQVCLHVLAQCETELLAGAIVTAEEHRLRIRPADSGNGKATLEGE